jgi:hypothetical protein
MPATKRAMPPAAPLAVPVGVLTLDWLVRHRPLADSPWMRNFFLGGNSEKVLHFFFIDEIGHARLGG